MSDLLDRSFSEIRMRHDQEVSVEPVRLLDVIEEVEATATEQARALGLTIEVSVAPRLEVAADRHYLVSALSNLVQNAIKYSKRGGLIRISGRETDKNVVVDVEDQCGGLPKGKAEELFKPFTQKSPDRTGLGLGLTISRKAIALNRGTLTVRNIPGKGCVFSISLTKRKAAGAAGEPESAFPSQSLSGSLRLGVDAHQDEGRPLPDVRDAAPAEGELAVPDPDGDLVEGFSRGREALQLRAQRRGTPASSVDLEQRVA